MSHACSAAQLIILACLLAGWLAGWLLFMGRYCNGLMSKSMIGMMWHRENQMSARRGGSEGSTTRCCLPCSPCFVRWGRMLDYLRDTRVRA